MVYCLWFMVYSLWFKVYGLWFIVYSSRFHTRPPLTAIELAMIVIVGIAVGVVAVYATPKSTTGFL